jgi:uncharacterized protein YqgC (DUF456 family)
MDPLLIVGAVLVVIGIIGSVVPVLPGPALSFVALILLFISKGSQTISVWSLVIFAVAMALLISLDYVAPILGAKFAGASKGALIWAIGGALIGIILFPPLGIFIGAIAGAIIGEMQNGKEFGDAAKAGLGVVVGSAMTIILQLVYSITAAVYFLVKVI